MLYHAYSFFIAARKNYRQKTEIQLQAVFARLSVRHGYSIHPSRARLEEHAAGFRERGTRRYHVINYQNGFPANFFRVSYRETPAYILQALCAIHNGHLSIGVLYFTKDARFKNKGHRVLAR